MKTNKLYKELKTNYLNLKKAMQEELKIDDNIYKEIAALFDCEKDIIYRKDPDTEYGQGLYDGAKKQLQYTIKKLINNKLKEYNLDCNIRMLKEFYNINQIIINVFEEDCYDLENAYRFENVQPDFESDYYIIDFYDGDSHNYISIDENDYSFEIDYELSDYEKELIKNSIE